MMANQTPDEKIITKVRWRLKYLRLIGWLLLAVAIGYAGVILPMLAEGYQKWHEPPVVIVGKASEGRNDLAVNMPPGFYQGQGFALAAAFYMCVQLIALAVAILCWPKRGDRLLIRCWDACQAAGISPAEDRKL